jgi:hypothetical protein
MEHLQCLNVGSAEGNAPKGNTTKADSTDAKVDLANVDPQRTFSVYSLWKQKLTT